MQSRNMGPMRNIKTQKINTSHNLKKIDKGMHAFVEYNDSYSHRSTQLEAYCNKDFSGSPDYLEDNFNDDLNEFENYYTDNAEGCFQFDNEGRLYGDGIHHQNNYHVEITRHGESCMTNPYGQDADSNWYEQGVLHDNYTERRDALDDSEERSRVATTRQSRKQSGTVKEKRKVQSDKKRSQNDQKDFNTLSSPSTSPTDSTSPNGSPCGESFFKTRYCKFFDKGLCWKGETCQYAHHGKELRSAPDLTKTRMCVRHRHGQCPRSADECGFAHSLAELRSTNDLYKTDLCVFWTAGHCRAGPACRHAHGESELRDRNPAAVVTTTPVLPQLLAAAQQKLEDDFRRQVEANEFDISGVQPYVPETSGVPRKTIADSLLEERLRDKQFDIDKITDNGRTDRDGTEQECSGQTPLTNDTSTDIDGYTEDEHLEFERRKIQTEILSVSPRECIREESPKWETHINWNGNDHPKGVEEEYGLQIPLSENNETDLKGQQTQWITEQQCDLFYDAAGNVISVWNGTSLDDETGRVVVGIETDYFEDFREVFMSKIDSEHIVNSVATGVEVGHESINKSEVGIEIEHPSSPNNNINNNSYNNINNNDQNLGMNFIRYGSHSQNRSRLDSECDSPSRVLRLDLLARHVSETCNKSGSPMGINLRKLSTALSSLFGVSAAASVDGIAITCTPKPVKDHNQTVLQFAEESL